MQYSRIEKNCYCDSLGLMMVSSELSAMEGVDAATAMMASKANLEIMSNAGFDVSCLQGASESDLALLVRTNDEVVAVRAFEAALKRIQAEEEATACSELTTVRSWKEAMRREDAFDLCLLSIPGQYAAAEADRALTAGKSVFLFSDNVSLEDEARLKAEAHRRGLLVMGPDCGTGIIGGVPLAFANAVRRGRIGIVGASGTGMQEISVAIDRFGGGVSNAIGTGGRDLNRDVGGTTMLDAISLLKDDPETGVVVVVSKPAAAEVEQRVLSALSALGKPAVVLFLGAKRYGNKGNIAFADNTEEAACLAVELAYGKAVDAQADGALAPVAENASILGVYSGGTLAHEAHQFLAARMDVGLEDAAPQGWVCKGERLEIIDMGDDVFTRGKPHPMIDNTARRQYLESLGVFARPTVVLLDVVLGYGASKDPANELAGAIRGLLEKNCAAGVPAAVAVNLLGTKIDVQGLNGQKKALEEAGAVVRMGNVASLEAALTLAGWKVQAVEVPPVPVAMPDDAVSGDFPGSQALLKAPRVLNVGLRRFAEDLHAEGHPVIHFDWRPVSEREKKLQQTLEFLNSVALTDGEYSSVDEANAAVIARVRNGAPYLEAVVPAVSVLPELDGYTLLHAGPPIRWEEMTSPMQGSCIGAALFEEWAQDEQSARALFEAGKVRFLPCNEMGFVGPMGGITSAHMPVLKVVNRTYGNVAYCTLNEGIGAVLRFGAYGPEVIERLRFIRDTLGPTLDKALQTMPDGLPLNTLIGKAICMGDEFHQRNIAASLVFLKEMAPTITTLDIPEREKTEVIRFLAETEQFFLNVMMAAAKSVMDAAAAIRQGTVVTVMSRNGKDFGIWMSGTGRQWFNGPVNTPVGLYFSGYSPEDANPDMGDSAITETFGVGGMAMIAAPAVTRYVGGSGFPGALEISNRMSEISISHNNNFQIPNWNFKGICLGIDVRKVVETGILPVINTGIAHIRAGVGQIGAGTVNPPMRCFEEALLAYARKLGYKEETT